MPLGSKLAKSRCSVLDLPVLPFLAPRISTPWRSAIRRAHVRAEKLDLRDRDRSPQGTDGEISHSEGQCTPGGLVRKTLSTSNSSERRVTGSDIEGFKGREELWESLSNHHGTDMGSAVQWSGGEFAVSSPNGEFSRKYEETWGTGSGASLPEGLASPGEPICNGEPFEEVEAKGHVRKLIRFDKRIVQNQENPVHRRLLREEFQREAYRQNIPEVRAKLVSLGRGPGFELSLWFSTWHTDFSILNQRYEKFMKGKIKLPQALETQFPLGFQKEMSGIDFPHSLRESWKVMPEVKRVQLWPKLMIMVLSIYPKKALQALEATYTVPYPPGYAVSDTIDYVISHYLRNRQPRKTQGSAESGLEETAVHIFSVIKSLVNRGPRSDIRLAQSSIHLLLINLTPIHVKELYEVLKESDHPLHKHTLMQFASRLGMLGETEAALEILKVLQREEIDFSSPIMSKIFSAILSRKYGPSDSAYSDSEVFQSLLDYGMKPNISSYNILLRNSLQAGDHDTGWQIHDMMLENGVKADAYTYSILLNDAKSRMDRTAMDRIIAHVRENGIRNKHITTDLLHAIFLLHSQKDTIYELPSTQGQQHPAVFGQMLRLYCEYFHLEPLAYLIPRFKETFPDIMDPRSGIVESARPEVGGVILENSDRIPNQTTSNIRADLVDPSTPTLVIMLTGLLKNYGEPTSVRNFYNHFRSLTYAKDPAVAKMMQSTNICNLVLMKLGEFADTLPDCSRVIGDMLSPTQDPEQAPASLLPSSEISSYPEGNLPIRKDFHQFRPDVHTWSILLKIFIDQGQALAAEKVLTMMDSHGVIPNLVTWNTLAIGYGRMQDPIMTVNVIERLENAGYEADDVTQIALGWIRDQRALIQAMRAKEEKDSGKRPGGEVKFLDELTKNLSMAEEQMEWNNRRRNSIVA